MQTPMKQCPQCGTITALNSVQCAQCGRTYQSTNPNRTQVIDPPNRARPTLPPWLFIAIPSAVAGFLILVIIGILLVNAKGLPFGDKPEFTLLEVWQVSCGILGRENVRTISTHTGNKTVDAMNTISIGVNKLGGMGNAEFLPFSEEFVTYIGNNRWQIQSDARVVKGSFGMAIVHYEVILYRKEGRWNYEKLKTTEMR